MLLAHDLARLFNRPAHAPKHLTFIVLSNKIVTSLLFVCDAFVVGVMACEISVLRNVFLLGVGECATDQVCPKSWFPCGIRSSACTRYLDTVCKNRWRGGQRWNLMRDRPGSVRSNHGATGLV